MQRGPACLQGRPLRATLNGGVAPSAASASEARSPFMNRITFTLPDVGLREIRGMVYVADGFLVLKIQNALLGMLDTEKEIVRIEPGALEDLRIKRGLFVDRLVLQPRRMDLLDLIPGEHRVAVQLRVWRKYRRELERLIEEFEALS